MDQQDAVDLLRPAIGSSGGAWADFGAGTGTFTRALATILGAGSHIFAIDRDARALSALVSVKQRTDSGPVIAGVQGDIEDLDAVAALADVRLDGAIFANALHFVPDVEGVLGRAVQKLRPGGRVVVIEYERDSATRWVPYPLPFARLQSIARSAGLTAPAVVAQRPSSFRGTIYCAAADRSI